ncbi:efflux RND transporter periplasmic adaptor subunit [Rhodoblastus sp.]|uniref:efflux RND transporter periplasmic adaptor subunit n=1 Tax=Rhodoblastus sp. TaxID=1962975 RepID=UPI003F99A348
MNENSPVAPTRHSDLEGSWRCPEPPAKDCPVARKRKRQRRVLGVAVLLLLGAGLTSGAWRSQAAREAAVDAKNQYRDIAPTVRVAAIKAAPATIDVTLPGATLAYATADIYARANGYVEKRNVDIGDHVKAGDVLAVLTAPELDHQIAQAEAAKAQAQATIRQSDANQRLAQVTNARSTVLVKQGWVTAQQGDTDRLNYAAQQAATVAAQASEVAQDSAIKVLRQQRDYLTVVAPFDGVITSRSVDTGALVQSQATLMFNLQQTDIIRVQVYVPQDQAFGAEPGVAVDVRVPEMPDRVFSGKITRIAESLQQGTRTLLVEADVPNPDGALRGGAYCVVELHIPRKTPARIVPAEALIFNRNGQQVAVVENDSVHLRKITVARDFGTTVEVMDGVGAGDQVVLNPMVNLADGQPVKIAPAPAVAKN